MKTQPPVLLTIVLAATACLAASPVNRGGLRTNYSKIVLENLPVGQTISMTRLANLPLVVGNNFDKPVTVTVSPRRPEHARDGYEPVPDAAWLSLGTSQVEVPAGGEASIDVTLNIPPDHYLFGRKFQVDLTVASTQDQEGGGVAFSYELTGSILFSIAPVANEKALDMALARPLNAAYRLDPPRVDLYEVEPGQRVQVMTEEGVPVQLTNASDAAQRFDFRSVDPAATPFTPDPGSQFSGQPSDVVLASSSLEIGPHEGKPLSLSVVVPEKADLTRGPLIYLVTVRSGDIQAVEQYLKIYLWSGKRPPKSELGKL